MSDHCMQGREFHTFRVKMDCEWCGTQKVITRRVKCGVDRLHSIGWVRQYGCDNCKSHQRTVGMAHYCAHGKYDRDFTGYGNGDKLRFIVENIDDE